MHTMFDHEHTARTIRPHKYSVVFLLAVRLERLSCPCRFTTPGMPGWRFCPPRTGTGQFLGPSDGPAARLAARLDTDRIGVYRKGHYSLSICALFLCLAAARLAGVLHARSGSLLRAQAPFLYAHAQTCTGTKMWPKSKRNACSKHKRQ